MSETNFTFNCLLTLSFITILHLFLNIMLKEFRIKAPYPNIKSKELNNHQNKNIKKLHTNIERFFFFLLWTEINEE